MRQRGDRQPQAERGIARRQEQIAAPELPALAAPAPGCARVAFQRWIGSTKPLRRVQPLIEHPRHARALFRIGQFGIAGIDIGRQRGFLLQPVRGILERRHDVFGIEAEPFARCLPQSARRLRSRPCAGSRSSRSGRNSSRSARRPCASRARTPSAAGFRRDTICPARNAASPPGAKRARSLRIRSSASAALGRADRGDIPFRRFQIVDGDEGRLAAHGQPHVARLEIGVDLFAELVEPRPGFVGERPA